MRAAEVGDDAAARCALQEAELEQERLVDILDRLGLLPERDRERRQPDRPAAHCLAAAMVFSGRSGWSTCGKIEKSTIPSAPSPPPGGFQTLKSSPMRGVITMLPALNPTQTALSDGKRSASPDDRM